MRKRNWIYSCAILLVAISFLLYFYNFTTSDANDLYLSVDYGNTNGWEITDFSNGSKNTLVADQAIDSNQTVFLTRKVTEQWLNYNRIEVDSGRAMFVFVDDELVFSNNSANISQIQELPKLHKPEGQPFSMVFSIQPSWVGKTVTIVTKLYENEPYASIGFNLRSDAVPLLQHEAWVNQHSLMGAAFGVLSLVLLGLFLFQFATSKKGYSILFLATASLLQMFCHMSALNKNPFAFIDNGLATALYFLFPLLYLGTKIKQEKKLYFFLVIFTWSVYFILYVITFVLYLPVPYWFDKIEVLCVALIIIMLYYCFKYCYVNKFLYNFLCVLSTFVLGYLMLFLITSTINHPINQFMVGIFKEASRLYLRPILFWCFTTIFFALIILSIWDIFQEKIFTENQIRTMENEQKMLALQIQNAQNQLTTLRNTHEQTIIIRHDMRHHLTLLSRFAQQGDLEKINEYLKMAKDDIDSATPIQYCENEIINLILAYFVSKAKKLNTTLNLNVHIPNDFKFNETELCSLFSNGLENAIYAASQVSNEELRKVSVNAFIKNKKLMIAMENPYVGKLQIENGLPKSQKLEPGHGFGIKSMINIVKKYDGLYSCESIDDVFILQLMLPLQQ